MSYSAGGLVLPQVLLAAALAAPAAAQLANPDPAAHGMGDNYTAVARGYAAVAWNPAALGFSGLPQASGTIAAVRVLGGMGPVTLGDLKTWQGEVVPLDVRERWLADIQRSGGQRGAAGFDLVIAAFQAGRVGGQVSTSGRTVNDIAPGVAELILIGNADESGTIRDIDLGGSTVDAHVYSTAGLSYAMPFDIPALPGRLTVGLTAKYTIGHVLGVTDESVGSASGDPAGMNFRFPLVYTPVVHSGTSYWIRAGGGFGLDLAAGYQAGGLTLGAVVQNVFNTFEWDHSRLRYRPLELVFRDGDIDTDVDWQPLSEAPAELRELVDESTFKPSIALGAALVHSPRLLVAADARFGSGSGMATRPPTHLGAGAELRPLRWLPIQAGLAYVSLGDDRSGAQISGGLGFDLGSFIISGSASRRDVGLGAENMFMVSLLNHVFRGVPRR